ncbi:MAG: deaminase [Chloroflexi bacterium 44-23]|nr:MAG: deaminase [Chloroflexi bacterium 44-23]
MRKLIVYEFISLDGVIQAPGGVDEDTDDGFAQGGWTVPYWHDKIGLRFFEAMTETDTFLLGRKTWQIHGAAFDPMPPGDPFGDLMNSMNKVVVSTTLKSAAAWRNSSLISKNVLEEVHKLKEQPGKNIAIDGSSVLIHVLVKNNLIDEYGLHVYPLVLGSGKRLFPEGKRINLKLIECEALPTGVVFQRFQPVD